MHRAIHIEKRRNRSEKNNPPKTGQFLRKEVSVLEDF